MSHKVLHLFNQNKTELIQITERANQPQNLQPLDINNPSVKQVVNLASDCMKGVIGLPNNTVEILFKPEIQEGLDENIYRLMTTNQGETLADVIDANGAIVGKGRIVEAGRTKQLLGGAFQLVSIAVAQSHLSDINRSLGQIQSSIERVLERMESNARSEIHGAIAYLIDVIEFMKRQEVPENLPFAKRMKIEDITYEFKKWRASVFSEKRTLLKKINAQEDLDTFGTGDTYLALKQHTDEAKTLNERYEILLLLVSIFNVIATYLDPQHKQFSRIDPQIEEWLGMMSDVEQSTKAKVAALLKSATFNQEETLILRQRDVVSTIEQQLAFALNQQRAYYERASQFSYKMRQLVNEKGSIKMSISFDESGLTKNVALIPV
jgi:hypothetical protein